MKTWPYRSNDTRSTPISRFSTKIFIFGGKKTKTGFLSLNTFHGVKGNRTKASKVPFREAEKSGREKERPRRIEPAFAPPFAVRDDFPPPSKIYEFLAGERERERAQAVAKTFHNCMVRTCCRTGLPDFSWYNIPKRGKNIPK
jgi:hypothetical protein